MADLPARETPRGKPVSLFVTCIVDMIYPQTGMSVVRILEHLGIPYDFPLSQTCCGQPAFNGGYRDEARNVARQFLRAFDKAQVIVTPSGSCAAMVRHEYPALFAEDRLWRARAERAAAITWEITEYLVDGLGIRDLNARLPQPQAGALHHACHGLRMLGLGAAARTLLENTENLTLCDLGEADVCCGFGGLFSVKMPNVSSAMLQTKLEHIEASPAEIIITGDASCLMQMNGGLSRHKSAKRVLHVVDVLASGLPEDTHHES